MLIWVWQRLLDAVAAARAGDVARFACALRDTDATPFWATDDTQRRLWRAAAAAPTPLCLSLLAAHPLASQVAPPTAAAWCYEAAHAESVVAWLVARWPPATHLTPAAREVALLAAGARASVPLLTALSCSALLDWRLVLVGALRGRQWAFWGRLWTAMGLCDRVTRPLQMAMLASPEWAAVEDAAAVHWWTQSRDAQPTGGPLCAEAMAPLMCALAARRMARPDGRCAVLLGLERHLVWHEDLPLAASARPSAAGAVAAATAGPMEPADAARLGCLDVLVAPEHWPRLSTDRAWRAALRLVADEARQPGIVALLDHVTAMVPAPEHERRHAAERQLQRTDLTPQVRRALEDALIDLYIAC